MARKRKIYVGYTIWVIISFLISSAIAALVNPATFGVGLSGNQTLDIGIRIVALLFVWWLLTRIGKPKRARDK